jgi:transposase-like protein
VPQVCRKMGISVNTFYRWKKKYLGMLPSDQRKLRQLEEDSRRLKRMVADLSLDKLMLQGGQKSVAPTRRRSLVGWPHDEYRVGVKPRAKWYCFDG